MPHCLDLCIFNNVHTLLTDIIEQNALPPRKSFIIFLRFLLESHIQCIYFAIVTIVVIPSTKRLLTGNRLESRITQLNLNVTC